MCHYLLVQSLHIYDLYGLEITIIKHYQQITNNY